MNDINFLELAIYYIKLKNNTC